MSNNLPFVGFSGGVEFRDSQSLDGYGRLRVSDGYLLFDTHNQYGNNSLFWEVSTTGSGTQTNSLPESAVLLTNTTASGDKVIRQTKHYFRYQVGKSQQAVMAFVLGAAATGLRKRIGIFDDSNGIYLEQTSSGLSLVTRSSTTGSVVNTSVAQSSWNQDKLDGTGSSGITLDPTKIQSMLIDYQFTGRVRVSFVINGIKQTVHTFVHHNILTTAFMGNPHLPLRQEIENTSATSSGNTLKMFTSGVVTEGGFNLDGITHAAANAVGGTSVSTRAAVLSIRPKLLFNTVANRGTIIPVHFEIASASQNIMYEIVYNGTLGGSPSWNSVGSNSIVEYDTAGTTVTGGEVIDNGFVESGSGKSFTATTALSFFYSYPLTLNIAGNSAAIISIVATAFTGSATVNAGVTWREIY